MSTYAERLEHWRTTYYDRRTVPYEMLQEAERIIKWGVRDAERSANVAVIRVEAKLEEAHAETERVRESLTKQIETLREHRDMLQHQVDAKRTIAETRSKEGDEVRVQIARADWKGWQVGDLEEIAYRLRCGGGVDETSVKITDREASALVPAPDLVKLDDPRRKPEVIHLEREVTRLPRWAKPAGATLVLASLVGLLNIIFGFIS